jgi:hypothetical protein
MAIHWFLVKKNPAVILVYVEKLRTNRVSVGLVLTCPEVTLYLLRDSNLITGFL